MLRVHFSRNPDQLAMLPEECNLCVTEQVHVAAPGQVIACSASAVSVRGTSCSAPCAGALAALVITRNSG